MAYVERFKFDDSFGFCRRGAIIANYRKRENSKKEENKSMKYYISKTDVSIDASGRLSGCERVLTKPDTLRATQNSLRRLTAIGIDNLHICEHPPNSRRWGKLQRAQNKLRKTRKLTMADVAKDLAELDAESQEQEDNS